MYGVHIAHLLQQAHNSKYVIFQERLLKVLKCSNFLFAQRRHNCSPAASFANCVMTLYLLKVHLQTFLSIPITQKCHILSCDAFIANERYYTYNVLLLRRWSPNILTFRPLLRHLCKPSSVITFQFCISG